MSRRVYANGVLLEEWDDATLTYRRYVNGEVVETRAYTGPEVAAIVGAGAVVLSERQMLVLDDDGTEIFRIGDMEHGDRGLVIRREDGSIAISLSQAFPGAAQQEIRIFDRFGNELLTEEAIGSGPAYPIFPLIFEPVLATAGTVNAGPYGFEVPTTSGTFVTVFRTTLARNNQFGTVKLRVAASASFSRARTPEPGRPGPPPTSRCRCRRWSSPAIRGIPSSSRCRFAGPRAQEHSESQSTRAGADDGGDHASGSERADPPRGGRAVPDRRVLG
jgi:hypothetical protein